MTNMSILLLPPIFAILFLPFESIYAEVIRRTALVEMLQKEYKIVITGPTTLGAIFNSLARASAHSPSKNGREKYGLFWER